MGRKFLGVDIQENALSAVLLLSSPKTRSMASCAQIAFPAAGSFEENIAQAFKTLAGQMPIEGSLTFLAIPDHWVTCRNLEVPFSAAKKIRQVLPFELEPRLPFAVEDLVVDFQKVRASGDHTRLLAVAAKTSHIKPWIDISAGFQADPETVVPGAYITAWWLAQQPDMPENWLLADIAEQRCGLAAVCNRKICLLRSFPVHLGNQDALETIGRHIQQTIVGMDAVLGSDFMPANIVLTGPECGRDGLGAHLSEQFDIPAGKLDLLKKSNLAGATGGDHSSHRLTTALACALSASCGYAGGLNLRQGPLAAQSRLIEYKNVIVQTGIFALIAVFFALAGIMSDIFVLEKQVGQLTNQIHTLFNSTLPKVQKIVDPIHQLTVEIEETKKNVLPTGFGDDYFPVVEMLLHLSREIPATLDVHFSNLVAGDQSILITGTTDSFNAVNEMTQKLERNPLFKNIKINSANMDQDGKRVRFKVRIQL